MGKRTVICTVPHCNRSGRTVMAPRPDTLYRRWGGGGRGHMRRPHTPSNRHGSGHLLPSTPPTATPAWSLYVHGTMHAHVQHLGLLHCDASTHSKLHSVHTHTPTHRSHSSGTPGCHVTGLPGASRSTSATRSLQLRSGGTCVLPPCLDIRLPAWRPERSPGPCQAAARTWFCT